MKKIKLYGERNCGTNYLDKLMRLNLEADFLRGVVPNTLLWTISEYNINLYFQLFANKNLGWKHKQVDREEIEKYKNFDALSIITISKNPYSFLLSLKRKPYHYKGDRSKSFLEFLQSSWPVTKRENVNKNQVKNPIELWNIKNKAYIELHKNMPNKTLNLNYENLLLDPKKVVVQISKHFNISMKGDFVNYTVSTKNSKKTFKDYQEYYLHEQWTEEMKREEIEFINQYLNKDVVKFFGYKILETVQ